MLHRSTTWVGSTAREIARAVRRGDTSATEVVADHLDSIRAYDRIVGAFRQVRAGEAIAEAEIVDDQPELRNLPLAGVPIAVKENTAVTGLPTWNGSAAARGPVAEHDHEVVRRLRGAGAVVVGVTKMPELGIWGITDDADGVTRNPWRTDRTPGGSSGGSAAAVAAGLVPIAHGNDGLGSIRIPAACCGLVGLKPGRGVVPAGIGANDWHGLAENGILATTVGDASLGFSVIAGRTPEALQTPGKLRIAVSSRSPATGVFPDAGTRKGLSDAVRLLLGLGHDAVRADPTYPPALAAKVLATWFAGAAVDAADLDVSRLQPRTRRHVALGERALRRGLVKPADRDEWRERCRNWFLAGGHDVLVTPALATAPPRAVRWSERSWSANMLVNARYAPYSAPWNFAGFPAIVIPVGVRADGLPAAVQFVGPPGSELLLLALAGQVEQAAPWRRHAPGWPRVAARR
ncbi:amidase family protein [Dactylosporangium sp. NPDC049742]|uniref:amidase n=1 Tax=Dactylosporangium sp. NPDC049742 TaxID=3154737 RepID=UPI00343D2926